MGSLGSDAPSPHLVFKGLVSSHVRSAQHIEGSGSG